MKRREIKLFKKNQKYFNKVVKNYKRDETPEPEEEIITEPAEPASTTTEDEFDW